MIGLLVVAVATVVWLRALVFLYHRGTERSALPSVHQLSPPAFDVDALDDREFRVWLGVLPETYDRYVAGGIERLEVLLAAGSADPAF